MPQEEIENYTLEGSRVHDLLIKICKRSSPLDLYIEKHTEKELTTITNIDTENSVIKLDSPPGSIRLNNFRNEHFSINGEIDGISFSFSSIFTDVALEAHIPDKIFYLQRRADYRVHVRLADKITVKMPLGKGETVSGTVRNLSAGGVGIEIRFTLDAMNGWFEGQIVEDCILSFTKGESFKCTLELCHIEIGRTKNCTIGAKFVELQPAQIRRLRMHVMELEREHKRLAVFDDVDN